MKDNSLFCYHMFEITSQVVKVLNDNHRSSTVIDRLPNLSPSVIAVGNIQTNTNRCWQIGCWTLHSHNALVPWNNLKIRVMQAHLSAISSGSIKGKRCHDGLTRHRRSFEQFRLHTSRQQRNGSYLLNLLTAAPWERRRNQFSARSAPARIRYRLSSVVIRADLW